MGSADAARRCPGGGDRTAHLEPAAVPWLVWPVHLGLVLLVGAAAAVWHAAATPEPPVSISSHAGAVDSATLLPALTAALVAGIGFRASRRGRGAMTGLLAVVLGWLLLVQGLPDVDVLWSANVLADGPQVAARVAVALLIALGAGFVDSGIAAVCRFREVAHRGAAPRRPVPVG